MTKNKPEIRPLGFDEIDIVKDFPPDDWHFDLKSFMKLHFNESYFYPFTVVENIKIAGIGNGILNGDTVWLGNIIVHEDFRRRGIGYLLTEYMIKFFTKKGCTSQILIATEMGEGLYRKLGFETLSHYIFFRNGKIFNNRNHSSIKSIQREDLSVIYEIDRKISGEDRKTLISNYFENGWIHFDKYSQEINGFYLPDFGNGMIISETDEAGRDLLRFKHSEKNRSTVIPSENICAGEFLRKNGFEEFLRAPRMVLGREISWKPEKVFCRGAGWCG